MGLNKAQQEAVAHFKGPCLVLAGPGSGKTLTIAKRIEYLIKVHKVRPEEILVITFTRYAANEMKKRFCALMDSSDISVNFGTFHSVFYQILKWAYGTNGTALLAEHEKYALLRQILQGTVGEGQEGNTENDYFRSLSEEIAYVKNNRWEIGAYRSRHYEPDGFRRVYQRYEELKRQAGRIDFEDMLVMCCGLFEERKDVLKKWRERFRYILIDEFQDINQAQYDVIRMLAAPGNNLFAVGDDDQSIYAFRGARPSIMLGFKKDYPDARLVTLKVNYRSTAHIVNGAQRVIRHNRKRYEKDICAQRAAEKSVHVQELKDALEEGRYILDCIRQALGRGVCGEEIAVLFRTAADAALVAGLLAEYQIPFRMKEKLPNLFTHFAAQDMFSYLKLSQGDHGRDNFLRVANRPNRYIGRDSMEDEQVTFEGLRRFYCDKRWMIERIDRMESDMEIIRGEPPYAAIQYIRKGIGYDAFLREYAKSRGMDSERLLEKLDEIQDLARGYRTSQEWLLQVQRYEALLREQERALKERGGEGIYLHTIHGAKGLEYDTVILMGANEGVMPYRKAKLREEVEEERRLFYVAATRAKNRLIVTYTRERNGKNMQISRFIYELTGSQKRKNDVE